MDSDLWLITSDLSPDSLNTKNKAANRNRIVDQPIHCIHRYRKFQI